MHFVCTDALVLILFTFLFSSCGPKNNHIKIVLDDFAYNTMPLPEEVKLNGKVVKRNFELQDHETHAYRDIDVQALLKGNLDTTFHYYPITIKNGTITLNQSTFQIGLIDENRNGKYKDTWVDKLIFIPKNRDSIYLNPLTYSSMTTLFPDTKISINGNSYRVKPEQDIIELSKLDPEPDTLHCIFNSTIPKLQVINEKGEALLLKDLKQPNKKLILELWFNGCRGCIKSLPKLKEIDSTENTIVSINVLDELSIINDFKERYDIHWPMIKLEKEDLYQLGNLGNYPSAIVYDKDGELEDFSKMY